MKLIDLKLSEFLEELAKDSPSPGGGSASALAGALGAALAAMVANLTLGKEKYRNVEDELKEISGKAASLKDRMMALVDEDSQAFDALLAAFRLPKDSAEAKERRGVGIQRATRQATEAPLEVAKHAIDIIKLAEVVIQKGNINAVTDGGVAALMGEAAFRGAVYNVKINLPGIADEAYKKAVEQELGVLEEQMDILKNGAAQLMDKKLL